MGVKAPRAAVFDLVHSDPAAAIGLASDELASEDDVARHAFHHWVRGLAHRELGNLDDAQSDLVRGRAIAIEAGDVTMAAQIAVSLALVVLYLGATESALSLLDEAEPHLTGSELGSCVVQRALVLHRLGRLEAADLHYERARDLFGDSGDEGGEARCLANHGLLLFQIGKLESGERALRRAIELGLDVGHEHVAAISEQNLGCLLARRGEVGDALAILRQSLVRFDALGNEMQGALARIDRAGVLLTVNMAAEAARDAEAAWQVIRDGGNTTDIADTALLLAHARSAVGDHDGARTAAAESRRLFEQTAREPWIPLARLAELEVVGGSDESAHDLADDVEELIEVLRGYMWVSEVAVATLLAVRSHLRCGRPDRAEQVLRRTNQRGGALSAFDRAALLLARAHVRFATGDKRGARRAVTSGLETLLENRDAIGALDLRASAADHAAGLSSVGVRLALSDGRAREALRRIEAARVLGSGIRGVRSTRDVELAGMLTRMRELGERHRTALPDERSEIRSRQLTLESEIRHYARANELGSFKTVSSPVADWTPSDVALIEYFVEHESLHAVSVVQGRAKLHRLAAPGEVATRLEGVRFALHRLARQEMSPASRTAAREALQHDAGWFWTELIPPRVRAADSVVIVPDATTHDVPWAAVFGPAAPAVTVAPSATAWQHARSGPLTATNEVLAVAGPALGCAVDECLAVMAAYGDRSDVGPRSFVPEVLTRLEHVDVAHFACHGNFRADNPMFSSLRLADGDLTVYDLEQCSRLPRTIVMSACNAGQNAAFRGGALLGMASALIQLGVSSVIAPLTPVNDERSVELMVRIHARLAAGGAPTEALAHASVGPDGGLDPTAVPFICFGS